MRKIVINASYGGFYLSDEAKKWLLDHGKTETDIRNYRNSYKSRDDELLVKCVEELGYEKASGKYSKIKIVEVPLEVDFVIEDYDGGEWVAEKHRTWS